jgi:hypothetical protein
VRQHRLLTEACLENAIQFQARCAEHLAWLKEHYQAATR